MSEPLRYASTESVPIERVERAISVVGAVHAFACLVYVSQRSYRWFAGTEDQLATTQTPAIATTGLALQFVAALVLLLACLARACCRTRFDRWIAVSAIVLGLVWISFGLMDDVGGWLWRPGSEAEWSEIVQDVLRELNQAAVPAVLAIVYIDRRLKVANGVAAVCAMVISCSYYLVAPSLQFYSIIDHFGWDIFVKWITDWQTLRANTALPIMLMNLLAFSIALVAILFLRRPWRIIAALPFAAWLIRDMVVNIPERMDRWSKLAGMDLVLAVSRNLSFVTVMSTATLLGVFVFTVAGVPKPRLFRRADLAD
jgi:hypothetical protein